MRKTSLLLKRSLGQIEQSREPFFLELIDLLGAQPLLWIPALEAVILGRITVFVLFENFLSARAEDKIGEQQGCMRMWCLSRDAGGPGVGGHDIHRNPFDRRARFE